MEVRAQFDEFEIEKLVPMVRRIAAQVAEEKGSSLGIENTSFYDEGTVEVNGRIMHEGDIYTLSQNEGAPKLFNDLVIAAGIIYDTSHAGSTGKNSDARAEYAMRQARKGIRARILAETTNLLAGVAK